jgi:hypothetical protein
LIPVMLAATLVWATLTAWRRSGATDSAARRAAVIVAVDSAAWMALTWVGAMSGILQRWTARLRQFLLVIVGMVAISLILAFGRVGTRIAQYIPLWTLVAIQGFRLPLELAMHALVARGIMPIQMSYSGRNFDIVTGATAIVVAMLAKMGLGGRRSRGCLECARARVAGERRLRRHSVDAVAQTVRRRSRGDVRHVSTVRLAAGSNGPRRAGGPPRDLQSPPSLIIRLFYELPEPRNGPAGRGKPG